MIRAFITFLILASFASCISCAGVRQTAIVPTQTISAAEFQIARRSAVQLRVDLVLDPKGSPVAITPTAERLASGTVIGFDKNVSLILTAAHFCTHEAVDYGFKAADGTQQRVKLNVQSQEFAVITADGTELPALVAYSTDDIDLCVMVAKGKAGDVIDISDEVPPVGAAISYVGAPGGVWNTPAVPLIEGRWSGIASDCSVFSMTIVEGASGSGVIYNGKLVSVVQRRANATVAVGYGPTPEQTFEFAKIARDTFYGI